MEPLLQTALTWALIIVGVIYLLACLVQILTAHQRIVEAKAYKLIAQEEELLIKNAEAREKREQLLHDKHLELLREQLVTEKLKQEQIRKETSNYGKAKESLHSVDKQNIGGQGIRLGSLTQRGTHSVNGK